MKESTVEEHLRLKAKAAGGMAVKLDPRGYVGIPDRLVILPGVVAFVELKRPRDGRVSTMQEWWHKYLREQGATVETLYTTGAVDEWIERHKR